MKADALREIVGRMGDRCLCSNAAFKCSACDYCMAQHHLANHATVMVDLVAACEELRDCGGGHIATTVALATVLRKLAAVHAVGHVAPTDDDAQGDVT